jgi:heat shock protein HslJ
MASRRLPALATLTGAVMLLGVSLAACGDDDSGTTAQGAVSSAQAAASNVQAAASNAQGAVSSAVGAAQSAVSSAVDAAKGAASSAVDAAKGAVSSAAAAASSALTSGELQGSWVLGAGFLDNVAGDSVPTIEFAADGTASGNAGCNTFTGPYESDGSKLTIGPLATTKMACNAVKSAIESQYLERLGNVAGYKFVAGRLVLEDSGGTTVLLFDKK